MDSAREKCYVEIEAMTKAALDRYYTEFPERLSDGRSDDALAWSLRGIHRIFAILDKYSITLPYHQRDEK
ncbi:MAG: hypothetical protein LC793_05120 [Thermomicrobia bacterium]|nr:hypothetical protein [Thermomicrobia bacterium]MCA1724699.1 hypothetical protein [Thermomicrobia bacterium]